MTRRQLTCYRAAADALCAALDAHNTARATYDLARDDLEDARRSLALASQPVLPERTTSEVREATQARALRQAREGLPGAETRLEIARTRDRAEREALRVVAGTGAE